MLRLPAAGFVLLAYAWSWAWWVPMVWTLRSRGIFELGEVPPWALFCALLGGYGPTAAALILTGRQGGRAGIRSLLGRLKLWRASSRVHLLIWFGPPAFLVVAMAVAPATASLMGEPVWSRLWLIPVAIAAAIPFGPMGEELGWRGYALPRLQHRYSALTSSLLIGLAWCFWHTPLFWAPAGTTISGHEVTVWAIAGYLAYTSGLSILHTWIFNNSRGSALLPIAFHTSSNAVVPLLLFPGRDREASLAIEWLAVVPLWGVALLLIAVYGGRRLSRRPLRGGTVVVPPD